MVPAPSLAWILLAPAVGFLLWRWRSGKRIADLRARGALILDVRTPEEFARGHAEGSVNLPLGQIAQGTRKLDKQRPILVCCASGARSAVAATQLRAQGFEALNAGPWTRLR